MLTYVTYANDTVEIRYGEGCLIGLELSAPVYQNTFNNYVYNLGINSLIVIKA